MTGTEWRVQKLREAYRGVWWLTQESSKSRGKGDLELGKLAFHIEIKINCIYIAYKQNEFQVE